MPRWSDSSSRTMASTSCSVAGHAALDERVGALGRVVGQRTSRDDEGLQEAAAAGQQEPREQLPRRGTVVRADADGAEERPVPRRPGDERPDATPQEEQRLIVALEFLAHERPAQFERRPHVAQQRRGIAKERAGVEAGEPASGHHRVGGGDAIRAGNHPLVAVPYEEMAVVPVESVEIQVAARALAGRAERDLAQASDLAQRERRAAARHRVDAPGRRVDEQAPRRQGVESRPRGRQSA